MMQPTFYNDFLFKKQKPKSDSSNQLIYSFLNKLNNNNFLKIVLESFLEVNEHQLVKSNEIQSLYNVSIATQDDAWICGRIFSDSNSNRLNEHNILLQGSYVCSNSHSIPLNLTNCEECSLFPGQVVLVHGRNPDGKKFICKQIVEPSFVGESAKKIKKETDMESYCTNNSIHVDIPNNEALNVIVASGPYMMNGTTQTNNLNTLLDVAIEKKAHVLILLGPFVDSNNELIAGGNIPSTYEELLLNVFDEITSKLRNKGIRVVIQPSLNDITQETVYPVRPFSVSPQFQKQNDFIHFVQEPNLIKINDIPFAITSTDIIKDLIMSSFYKTSSSDKISRNFAHLLRQRTFYPIYPPPDHVCIDYEAWMQYARIDLHPKVFIAVSDLANFNKEVNNCVCLNPGKLVKGTSVGGYAHISLTEQTNSENNSTNPNITVTFHKLNQ